MGFFGWGPGVGLGVGFGFGFGHVGWVPLAPFEVIPSLVRGGRGGGTLFGEQCERRERLSQRPGGQCRQQRGDQRIRAWRGKRGEHESARKRGSGAGQRGSRGFADRADSGQQARSECGGEPAWNAAVEFQYPLLQQERGGLGWRERGKSGMAQHEWV